MANEFRHGDVGTDLTQAEWEAVGTHILNSQATGDIIYASSSSQLSRLGKATDGNILQLASGIPAWTSSPTIGSTSWVNANHAHAAGNSGGTVAASTLSGSTLASGVTASSLTSVGTLSSLAITGTLTVGVNDTGHDAKFFGATSGKYMLWDESEDTLAVVGSVGIGTASPDDLLEIEQATGPHMLVQSTGANSEASIRYQNDAREYVTGVRSIGGDDSFFLYDITGTADRLTINSDGEVGINNNDPDVDLIVTGSAAQIKADSGGDDHVYLYAGNNSGNSPAIGWTSGNLRFWGGLDCFQIAEDGGLFAANLLAASASTDVNINGSNEIHSVTSSEYYKYNKRPISIDTSLIYQLQPRSYRFGEKKSDAPASWPESEGETDDFGLTAEEVYRVLPELVNMREGKPYSVRYSMLSVLLLNEVKKLRDQVLV